MYILRSLSTGRFYIGQTRDIDARVARHNAGGNVSTRRERPWELVYVAAFRSRSEAVREEMRLKGFKSHEYLARHIANSTR